MTSRHFPVRIDEIKPAWLSALLHHRGAPRQQPRGIQFLDTVLDNLKGPKR